MGSIPPIERQEFVALAQAGRLTEQRLVEALEEDSIDPSAVELSGRGDHIESADDYANLYDQLHSLDDAEDERALQNRSARLDRPTQIYYAIVQKLSSPPPAGASPSVSSRARVTGVLSRADVVRAVENAQERVMAATPLMMGLGSAPAATCDPSLVKPLLERRTLEADLAAAAEIPRLSEAARALVVEQLRRAPTDPDPVQALLDADKDGTLAARLSADPLLVMQELPWATHQLKRDQILRLARLDGFSRLTLDEQRRALEAVADSKDASSFLIGFAVLSPELQQMDGEAQASELSMMLARPYAFHPVRRDGDRPFDPTLNAVTKPRATWLGGKISEVIVHGHLIHVHLPNQPTVPSLETLADALSRLPPERVELIADIYLHAERRGNVIANANRLGRINVYHHESSALELAEHLDHEVGHVRTLRALGFIGWFEYKRAIEADGNFPSEYARIGGPIEDAAEMQVLRDLVEGTENEPAERRRYPHRFALFDRLPSTPSVWWALRP